MGQKEVYEFLSKNPKKWFSIREIKEALDKKYPEGTIRNVSNYLYRMAVYKIVEVKGKGIWNYHVYFRLNKQKKRNKA